MTRRNLSAVGLAMLTALAGSAQAASCDASATLISSIQGNGKTSPMVGKQVNVKGIVTAVIADFHGFYIQQQQDLWDSSGKTSEGIFVYNKKHTPKVGDEVALSAKVVEYKDLTQLTKLSSYSVCSQGHSIAPTTLTFPLKDRHQLESLEGMLVRIPQTLTISDNYGLVKYGQMLLSNGRLYQPTNLSKPGPAAREIARMNQLNQIMIDDLSSEKNPAVNFTVDHPYRAGNQVNGVEGVIHYSYGNYMIEPTAPMAIVEVNHREPKPVVQKQGKLRVASFNVLNYFNGIGPQKTFPTKRGAHSKAEFERQNAKIIAAMKTIDADIFGLMEVENDGFGPDSAIAELTSNLSKATGKPYAFVRAQTPSIGDDAITVGMIYNKDTVQTTAKMAMLSESPFNSKSRIPMAQTFIDKSSGEAFTLVVNHFKSKGSCPKDKSDPNAAQGDGQGCWNVSRTLAASKLAKWLATDPTGSGEQDILIIGDLNANAKEQPITALEDAGYTNLIEKYQGKHAYSYVYRGLAGYLDHALASKSLAAQVADATDWHINADEMRITDYNLENKTTGQSKTLYRADAFRSSDHDPMIVELTLK